MPQVQPIRAAITPLRMIFWGGLLCVFDFKFNQVSNGQGYSFDILNDALGVLLILVGVIRLRAIGPAPGLAHRPSGKLAFAAFVAVLALLKAVHGHLIYRVPDEMSLVLTAVSLLSLAAILGFCTAMQEMCRDWGLVRSQGKWGTTAILFGFIYVAPLGLFYVYSAAVMLDGGTFNIGLGPEGLLLLIPLLIPLVMLFTTTSSMVTEIRMQQIAAGAGDPSAGRPPVPAWAQAARNNPTVGQRQWTVKDEPPQPRHPGATDRYV